MGDKSPKDKNKGSKQQAVKQASKNRDKKENAQAPKSLKGKG